MTGLDWFRIAQGTNEERVAALSELINENYAKYGDEWDDAPLRDLHLVWFCDGWEASSEIFLAIYKGALGGST